MQATRMIEETLSSTSTSRTREVSLETLNRISDMDPDGLLKWELDFPESCQHFVPFLSTQIRIDEEGILHYRYYRKSQKKDIKLLSHCNNHRSGGTVLVSRYHLPTPTIIICGPIPCWCT